MHTSSYSGRLLVIGQALNGWMVKGLAESLGDSATRTRILAEARYHSEAENAWDWMWPQPWSRPFWKLARTAMDYLSLELRQIAWSNLAKVAPPKGNPRGALIEGQWELGGRLLRQEVKELDPELVLVISGRGFTAPFLSHVGIDPKWSRDGARQFDGSLDGRRWLIVNHPGTFADRFRASKAAVESALTE
jgi:hypothetical protein